MDATTDRLANGHHDTPERVPSGPRPPRPRRKIDGARVRYGLLIGTMEAGTGYVTKTLFSFRRAVVDALERQPGRTIGVVEAGLIQSALRWERVALLAQRYLRRESDKLDAAQRLAYLKATAECSSRRDSCLEKLGLQPGKPFDPWSIIDSHGTPEAAVAPGNASGPQHRSPSDPAATEPEEDAA